MSPIRRARKLRKKKSHAKRYKLWKKRVDKKMRYS